MRLEFNYPKMIWPYFGNIQIILKTEDDIDCQKL